MGSNVFQGCAGFTQQHCAVSLNSGCWPDEASVDCRVIDEGGATGNSMVIGKPGMTKCPGRGTSGWNGTMLTPLDQRFSTNVFRGSASNDNPYVQWINGDSLSNMENQLKDGCLADPSCTGAVLQSLGYSDWTGGILYHGNVECDNGLMPTWHASSYAAGHEPNVAFVKSGVINEAAAAQGGRLPSDTSSLSRHY